MLARILEGCFLLAASFLLAVAAFDYFAPPQTSVVTVAQPDRTINVGPPGRKALVNFEIDNTGTRPVRVVGLTVC